MNKKQRLSVLFFVVFFIFEVSFEEPDFLKSTSYAAGKNITYFTQEKPVALEAKLMASDAVKGATFGNSVDISGDTAVIGAWQQDIGTKRTLGAVYVFVRKENAWVEQAKLIAADGAMKDYFGESVAIDGDTLVVGVPQADIGKDKDQGAVYVFTRKGDHWTEQVKLKATGGASADLFGKRVGISGDTIIVGAPGTDNFPNDNVRTANGAAYIFTRNNNVWSEKQKLTGDRPSSVAFGINVAIDNKTAVISNSGEDGFSDVLYIFSNAKMNWKQEAKISSPRNETEKVLSNSISNNLAIDGNTIAVGGSQKGNNSDGAVYVYVRDNGVWTRHAKLSPSDGIKGDNFGWSVDISNDTIIVGAWLTTNQLRGAAYIFKRKLTSEKTTWIEQQKLTVNDSLLGDHFGCSVGISEDRIIIGADNHDIKVPNSNYGAAYIFNSSTMSNSLVQRSSERNARKIMLQKDARTNGYTITREAQAYYFQANNVEDPLLKKLLEAIKKLEYRCRQDEPMISQPLTFSNGRSNRVKVSCSILIEPQILLLDESNES